MIRKLMLAVGLFTMTGASAMAATTHARTHHKVAQAGDTNTDAPKAKKGKAHKGGKKAKGAEGGEKTEPAKAEPAPAPAK